MGRTADDVGCWPSENVPPHFDHKRMVRLFSLLLDSRGLGVGLSNEQHHPLEHVELEVRRDWKHLGPRWLARERRFSAMHASQN